MKTLSWIMIAAQMLSWAWFSVKVGKLSDKQFLLFTAGMAAGNIGAGLETLLTHAWGTFASQLFYLSFTVWGGYQRFAKIRQEDS